MHFLLMPLSQTADSPCKTCGFANTGETYTCEMHTRCRSRSAGFLVFCKPVLNQGFDRTVVQNLDMRNLPHVFVH